MILDKIFIIIKNNAKKLLKFSFLSLFIFVPFLNVSALSFASTSSAYGYTQTYNGVTSSRTFTQWNSNNFTKYNYDLPNSSEIDIDEFDIRMTITDNFQKDTTYQVSFDWYNYDSQNDVFYTYFSHLLDDAKCRVSSWSSTNESATSCFDSWNVSGTNINNEYVLVLFTFTPKKTFYGLTLYFTMPSPYNSYPSEGWEILNLEYRILTGDASQIINNQNQNTQNIINNQNQNTQNIINNQNQNTQAIIDSNKSCTIYDVTNIYYDNKVLVSSGSFNSTDNINYGTTNYISISDSDEIYRVSSQVYSVYLCFYNSSKSSLGCVRADNTTLNSKIDIPTNTQYFRFSVNKSNNAPQYKVCKNGNQAVTDTLTDTTPPDSSPIANATGWLPAGPVDSILNLPLTLMNSISNVISSGVCQPITIDLPHITNSPLVIPCMSTVWANIGLGTFFTWFGRILGGIILYKYLIRLYKWVDDTLTMRENNNFDDGSMG